VPTSGALAESRARRATACLLAALALLALGLRLAVAWGELSALVRDVTPDDAYYYFQIARNLGGGRGPSLDGETPTNGFHPLWLLLLLPLSASVADPLLALRAGLSLGALLGAANVALVFALARAAGAGRPAALVAAAAYAIHPTVIRESVNGLETSLAVATQGASAWLYLRLAGRPGPPSGAACAGLGAAGGLMMLARTDAVFVFAALLAGLLLRERRSPRRGLAGALVAGLWAALVVSPWLLWNLASFGSVVQVSASAIAEPLQRAWIARHGADPAALLGRAAEVTLRDFGRAAFLYFAPGREAVRVFAAAAPALLALALLVPPAPARRLRGALARLAAPAGGIVGTLLVHTAVRWWTREWYYAPIGFLGAVVLALLLDHAQATAALLARGWRFAPGAALAAAGCLLLAALGPHQGERWGLRSVHRLNQLEAAIWLAQHTSPDARIGSFNAGILSYFARRTVVNLDGAVNADALRAREAGRVMEYVLQRRLDTLADFRSSLRAVECAESPLAACETLAQIGEPVPQFGGTVRIVRVRPRAPPPSAAEP
jgi:hypothetical protein